MAWGAWRLNWSVGTGDHGDLLRLAQGLGLLAACAVAYFATLWLLGFRLRQFVHRE